MTSLFYCSVSHWCISLVDAHLTHDPCAHHKVIDIDRYMSPGAQTCPVWPLSGVTNHTKKGGGLLIVISAVAWSQADALSSLNLNTSWPNFARTSHQHKLVSDNFCLPFWHTLCISFSVDIHWQERRICGQDLIINRHELVIKPIVVMMAMPHNFCILAMLFLVPWLNWQPCCHYWAAWPEHQFGAWCPSVPHLFLNAIILCFASLQTFSKKGISRPKWSCWIKGGLLHTFLPTSDNTSHLCCTTSSQLPVNTNSCLFITCTDALFKNMAVNRTWSNSLWKRKECWVDKW